MSNKLDGKFKQWRDSLTQEQRKKIKTGIDIAILLLILGGLLNMYEVGKQNGKIEFCKEQDMIFVKFQGIHQCWTKDAYEEYMNQWSGGLDNGLQYLNS